jgi:hypothetical protein
MEYGRQSRDWGPRANPHPGYAIYFGSGVWLQNPLRARALDGIASIGLMRMSVVLSLTHVEWDLVTEPGQSNGMRSPRNEVAGKLGLQRMR